MTAEQLAQAIGCLVGRAEKWLPHLDAAMTRFEINTRLRKAAFLAQVAHESARLSVLEENLNYSVEALLRVFPRHFKTRVEAAGYARRPERIANRVYASRMGNGAEGSGDGWRYRGRGPIQLTGKDNYRLFSEVAGVDCLAEPTQLARADLGALAAAWYWHRAGCNIYADLGDFDGVSDMINIGRKTEKAGDSHGYQDRAERYGAALIALQTEEEEINA